MEGLVLDNWNTFLLSGLLLLIGAHVRLMVRSIQQNQLAALELQKAQMDLLRSELRAIKATVKVNEAAAKEHYDKCDEIPKEVLSSKLDTLETEVNKLRHWSHWVSNSLVRIGASCNVELSLSSEERS